MVKTNTYYRRFAPIWPGKTVGEFLGSGSYGDVWELTDACGTETAEAVKEVLIPPETAGGLDEARLQGLDFEGAKIYFAGMKQRALDEVRIMQTLSRCPSIVQISDCELRELDESAGEVGWVAFIRMERLRPLKKKLSQDGITLGELIRLGIDICLALEACAQEGIVHRDVKPENLFLDPRTGRFKLGDFGISCYLSRPTEGKGLPGTLTHMSPQVYRGEPFTPADDLYALGMVLYKLLNDNRIPLLPPFPQPFSPAERDRALALRLRGAKIPAPAVCAVEGQRERLTLRLEDAELPPAKALAEAATRAIDPDPSRRFPSAKELRQELERLETLYRER